jgi:nucleoside-diphosphate kinase
MMEKTVVLVKPDGLQRGLVGEIVSRFERKGLKLVGIKMIQMTDSMIDNWYAHHKEKSFFSDLKKFMEWTPIIAMVWEGLEVIPAVRKIVGSTKGREAEAGSIRGDFGMSGSQNLIHASDSVESAEKEMAIIFNADEIFEYQSGMDCLIYGDEDMKKK